MAKPKCGGTKKDGSPCTFDAKKGSDFCGRHKPGANIGRPKLLPTDVFAHLTDPESGQQKAQTYEQAICGLISIGSTRHRAALQLHMAPLTIQAWLQQGEADFQLDNESVFSHFYLRYEAARSMFVTKALQRIDKAGKDDWKAAVAALKLIHREEFGEHATLHHEGSIGLVEKHAADLTAVIVSFLEELDLTPDQAAKVPDALERHFGSLEQTMEV